MGLNVEGNVALVTGAAMGLGRAIALSLARAGANVGILDREEAPAREVVATIDALGRRAAVAVVDVRDGPGVDAAVARLHGELGAADILVNCAGVGHEDASFVELPRASWQAVLDVCVVGTLHVTQAVLPAMIARRRGRIVNLASELAFVGSSHAAVYAAAKAAVLGFTRSVARDVAHARVTVNAVCPGDVETERSLAHEAELERTMTRAQAEARRRQRVERIPLGRVAQPADVAAAVLFFCSPEAGYVTGQSLLVNGGSTMT